MLHILWLIIKWILILLGILIGLIFLILLLLLFCPIRYRGNLKKDRTDSLREIHATGEVSWLLHIISAQVFWEQSVLKTKICFLGIPLEKLKNLFRKKKRPRALSNSGNQNAKKQTEASRSHEKTSKSENQNDTAELQMSEPQEDTVEDINENVPLKTDYDYNENRITLREAKELREDPGAEGNQRTYQPGGSCHGDRALRRRKEHVPPLPEPAGDP